MKDNNLAKQIDTFGEDHIGSSTNTPLRIDLIGKDFQDVDDKWQGAFVGSDNKIYAIPENISNVMVITAGKVPSVEMLT